MSADLHKDNDKLITCTGKSSLLQRYSWRMISLTIWFEGAHRWSGFLPIGSIVFADPGTESSLSIYRVEQRFPVFGMGLKRAST